MEILCSLARILVGRFILNFKVIESNDQLFISISDARPNNITHFRSKIIQIEYNGYVAASGNQLNIYIYITFNV